MKWLKNLFKRKKKSNLNYVNSIARDPKTGKWIYDNNSTDVQALLGVVAPKTCKCGGNCGCQN